MNLISYKDLEVDLDQTDEFWEDYLSNHRHDGCEDNPCPECAVEVLDEVSDE